MRDLDTGAVAVRREGAEVLLSADGKTAPLTAAQAFALAHVLRMEGRVAFEAAIEDAWTARVYGRRRA